MISKEAVQAFLTRPRESWSRYKRYSRADLLEELDERGIPRTFATRPRLHQLACYLVGMLNPRFLFLLDMGLGKTKLVLDLFNAHRNREDIQALVLVPKKVHMGTWEEQVRLHAPGLTLEAVSVTSTEAKWSVLEQSPADVIVCDYQGFMLATTRKVAGKLAIDKARIRVLSDKFDFFVFDESHRTKNKKTLRFSLLRAVSKHARNVYALTGTPQGRDPQDLWGQFFLVDHGYTLGETLGLFRQAFFTEKPNYFGGRDYKFDKSKQALVSQFIQHASITYDEHECLDLPPFVPVVRRFKLTAQQRQEYNKLREGRIIEGVRVPVDGVFHRMREITSGYQRVNVNGVTATRMFEYNPKLELLEQDLVDMPDKAKAILFYDYTPTGDLLASLLDALKLKHVRLDGRTKDPIAVERTFKDSPRVRVLLCNSGSGSEGINAQAATYQFFYESPVSPITRRQAIKRAHRQGQTSRVLCFDYVAQGSVDQSILDYIKEGADMLQALKRGASKAQQALFGAV